MHVIDALAAMVVCGQVTLPTFGSFTTMLVIVTLPVLVTRKVYGIT